MQKYRPIFIVGTGRCGSTLLSNLLNQHPDLLSVSEFFMSVTDFCTVLSPIRADVEINGSEFWELISRVMPKQDILLKNSLQIPELLYPFTDSDRRFNQNNGIPALLQTTLPLLCAAPKARENKCNPDALYDKISKSVTKHPVQTLEQHYRYLFLYLCQLFGRQFWIERSGSSIRHLPYLVQNFPDAQFIHIVRDGRNCAISMEEHTGFRMGLISIQLAEILGYDPYESNRRDNLSDLPDDLANFLPENFSAAAFRDYRQSPSLYGIYWSGEIIEALRLLSIVPSEQVLTIQYEEILNQPKAEMSKLVQFIDNSLLDLEWLNNLSAQIRPPRAQWQILDPDERHFLEEACRPGFNALQDQGLTWK